jgi:hypothetical protein
MLKYFDIYRTIVRTFGFRLRPFGTFGLMQVRRLLDATTRGLDHVLFPGFRRLPLDRPVFILGNPRSGTTFLHRFLLNTDRLAAFALYEMLFPAITARKLLGGVVHRFAPFSPARYHSSAAHETSLRDVEADDVMTFFHFLEGGFLWSYFSAWTDTWGSDRCRRVFWLDDEPLPDQERYFRFLEACWRRNLYAKRQARLVAKASTFTLRVKTLLRRYPDCKILYMVRDPVATIPSGMSLVTGVLERAYDMFHRTREADRQRYLENLYQASCHLFRYFHDVWRAGAIPERNLHIVTYPRLMGELEPTMRGILEFLEIDPAPGFAEKVREQAEKQRTRRSEHEYSPEQFGLSADRIRADLRFVYQSFAV